MLWAWLGAAIAGPQVLLVTSPGVSLDAYLPLIQALRSEHVAVDTVVFPCSGTGEDFRAKIRRQGGEHPGVVVAHGLGATLALQSGLPADRFVLLGPVLDVVPNPALQPLIDVEIPARVRLDTPWRSPSIQSLLLGDWTDRLGCVSPSWATEVQTWLRDGSVPLDLSAVVAPVWLGLGALDEVATVEATVPASRLFPQRTLVRLGVARMDPKDYRHLDLLADAVPIRAAVRAVLATE